MPDSPAPRETAALPMGGNFSILNGPGLVGLWSGPVRVGAAGGIPVHRKDAVRHMMKSLIVLLVMGLATAVPSGASAWSINFENGVDGNPVSDIPGISFHSFNGFDAVYGDSRTEVYNTYSDDLGMGWNDQTYHHDGDLWLWAGPDATAEGVIVDFDNNDGTFFSAGYSSYSGFYLVAHLTDTSVATAVGGSNRNHPLQYLTVNATAGTFIDYVVLHDSGNEWLVDDLSGDATGVNPVPEPASVALFGLGIAAFVLTRSRRRT